MIFSGASSRLTVDMAQNKGLQPVHGATHTFRCGERWPDQWLNAQAAISDAFEK